MFDNLCSGSCTGEEKYTQKRLHKRQRHNEVRFKQMKDQCECYFNAMLTGGTESDIAWSISYLTSKDYSDISFQLCGFLSRFVV